jgi:tetratricopeptide (TPR) repeat protein
MYLKTKKQYRKGGGSGRRSISRRVLVLAIVAGLGVLLADFVLKHQDPIRERITDVISHAEERVSTMRAPTPTPAADPMLCLSRANVAYEAGQLSRAIDYYDCAVAGMPNDVQTHVDLAFLLTISNRPAEGYEAAKRAIMADPTDPDGYAIAGMALSWLAFETGDEDLYGTALAHELRALDIDANHADAYAYMAEIYADLERLSQAQSAAEKALELAPDNFKAHRNYGYVLERQIDYQGAVAEYEEAVRLNPKLPYLRTDLARMYLNLDRAEDAMDLLQMAVQISGGDPNTYWLLGRVYSRYMGDYVAAQETFETCVEVDPAYSPCWVRLAGVLLFNQDYDLALNAYNRAIELETEDVEAYYYAAYIEQLNDRCEQAVGFARQGLALPELTLDEESDLQEILDECLGGEALPASSDADAAEADDSAGADGTEESGN